MNKCIRLSDNAQFECVKYTGENASELRGLFQWTDTKEHQVVICTTDTPALEFKILGTEGKIRSYYAQPGAYVVNEYGKPFIYGDEESFLGRFCWAGGRGAGVVLQAVTGHPRRVWDDFDNLLDVRNALDSVVTADVYTIHSYFDEEDFRDFIGNLKFVVTRSHFVGGSMFEYLEIYQGSLVGRKIKPGDSVIRLSNGQYAVTSL